MEIKQYISDFEKLGFGMFVHFGLFSVQGAGEWYFSSNPKADEEKYFSLINKFDPSKTWAKDVVSVAKSAGCKYITLTTRHHEGFSLYDVQGLNEFDAPHSKCKRDLVSEFVSECNKQGIVPFFYHTLLDWHEESYKNDFPSYLKYLRSSIEILCRNYGKIGGLWFDGTWDKPDADWEFDKIYAIIRKYQPTAMIINNTGLSDLGKVGDEEIDSVTFERGKPNKVQDDVKYRAGEMCQVLNDHWGYAENDLNYKTVPYLLGDLIDCRANNCNYLLNVGPTKSGKVRDIDKAEMKLIGQWIKANKNFIYNVKGSDLPCENATLLTDGKYYYAVIRNVCMSGDPNVQREGEHFRKITLGAKIRSAKWLDSGEKITVIGGNSFFEKPFYYGTSLSLRVAKIELIR